MDNYSRQVQILSRSKKYCHSPQQQRWVRNLILINSNQWLWFVSGPSTVLHYIIEAFLEGNNANIAALDPNLGFAILSSEMNCELMTKSFFLFHFNFNFRHIWWSQLSPPDRARVSMWVIWLFISSILLFFFPGSFKTEPEFVTRYKYREDVIQTMQFAYLVFLITCTIFYQGFRIYTAAAKYWRRSPNTTPTGSPRPRRQRGQDKECWTLCAGYCQYF